ncbi:hypothetical protein EXIGLDRAFT_706831 [Exidia glandulosa HHB12029]|uniref:Uncharacterized protein n=1 Tax=Exidia glandulosa HHB12029 TaxID=1314781 RepID=A0A165AZB6_EXIGL|nr:hypothetical protein EXIGLDRAFT_706831 [Exidia glandulosa HHB12029]
MAAKSSSPKTARHSTFAQPGLRYASFASRLERLEYCRTNLALDKIELDYQGGGGEYAQLEGLENYAPVDAVFSPSLQSVKYTGLPMAYVVPAHKMDHPPRLSNLTQLSLYGVLTCPGIAGDDDTAAVAGLVRLISSAPLLEDLTIEDWIHPATMETESLPKARLPRLAKSALREEVNNSPKLELLRHRVEFSAKGRAESPVLLFRSYLKIRDGALRHALTRLLVSDHRLSIEILRRAPVPVPREERLCRFCIAAVEDPIHALFECDCSLELVVLRRDFWEKCKNAMPSAETDAQTASRSRRSTRTAISYNDIRSMTSSEALFALLGSDHTCNVLALFTVQVFALFAVAPPYDPGVSVSPET